MQVLWLLPAGCEDGPFKDGGLVDRVGLAGWRRRRAARASRNGGGGGNAHGAAPPALIHLIQRSSAFSGDDDVEATGALGALRSLSRICGAGNRCNYQEASPAAACHWQLEF